MAQPSWPSWYSRSTPHPCLEHALHHPETHTCAPTRVPLGWSPPDLPLGGPPLRLTSPPTLVNLSLARFLFIRSSARDARQLSRTAQHTTGTAQHITRTAQHATGTAQHVTRTAQHTTGTAQHVTRTAQHATGTAQHVTRTAQHATGTAGWGTAEGRCRCSLLSC